MPSLNQDLAEQFANNIVGSIATLMNEHLSSTANHLSRNKVSTLIRLKQYLAAHLDDNELTPAKIADSLGISVRYINKLLLTEKTSISRLIWSNRFRITSYNVCYTKLLRVSEVHLILGSTLFFLFGVVPTAVGLAGSLLVQGVLFAPFDLPQYGMNVTTLLASLFVMHKLAKKIIAPNTPYIDLSYKQVFKLSVVFQAGIVSWVGFWNFYGQGFSPNSITNIALFAASYRNNFV